MKNSKYILFSILLVCSFIICGCDNKQQETVCEVHNYSEERVLKDANCDTEGVAVCYCEKCGRESIKSLPKQEHSLNNGTIIENSTCEQSGLIKYKCGDCDYECIEIIPQKEHILSEVISNSVCDYRYCKTCGENRAEIPVVSIVTNDGSVITDEYVDSIISISNCDDKYILEDVSAEVKVRGNGSATYNKKPYRIKFSKKQMMLNTQIQFTC